MNTSISTMKPIFTQNHGLGTTKSHFSQSTSDAGQKQRTHGIFADLGEAVADAEEFGANVRRCRGETRPDNRHHHRIRPACNERGDVNDE